MTLKVYWETITEESAMEGDVDERGHEETILCSSLLEAYQFTKDYCDRGFSEWSCNPYDFSGFDNNGYRPWITITGIKPWEEYPYNHPWEEKGYSVHFSGFKSRHMRALARKLKKEGCIH